MRWGHDFLRIRGGIFKPLGQWGKAKSQRENPSNYQLPFLSYSPNHLLLPEVGWVGYCMGWERYDNPNSNWRSHQFLGNVFWLLGQVKTQKRMPFYHDWRFFMFSPPFFLHVELWEAAGTSCVWNHSRSWLLPHFAQSGKLFLVIISGWVSFPTFLLHFSHCFQAGNRFPAMPSKGKKRPTILGVVESVLATLGPKRPWK